MSELFPIASITKLTPRAAWMKKNCLVLREEWSEWDDKVMWTCTKDVGGFRSRYGWGETEHDAICEWAIKNNVRLWNEEQK